MLLALGQAGLASLSFSQRVLAASGLRFAALLLDAPQPTWPGVRAVLVDDDWYAPTARGGVETAPVAGEEVCRVVFSSGTTGLPKPIRIPANVFEVRLERLNWLMSGGGYERLLCRMGLASAWGSGASLAALTHGKTVMLASETRETLDIISLARPDRLMCSADQLRALLDLQEERFTPCDSLRWIVVGGSVVSMALIDRARRLFPARILVGYGATETGVSACCPAETLPRIDGAAGFVAPWATIEAVDADDRPLPRGVEGRIRSRADVQAYWDEAQPSGEHPWFYPGDLGVVRPDGCLIITGRVSEIINVGGLKIAPTAIEEVLLSHPDVVDAAAVSVVGADGFEQAWAAVVTQRPVDEAALIAFCEPHLAGAAPSRIVTLSTIPRVANGKVARPQLREALTRMQPEARAQPAP